MSFDISSLEFFVFFFFFLRSPFRVFLITFLSRSNRIKSYQKSDKSFDSICIWFDSIPAKTFDLITKYNSISIWQHPWHSENTPLKTKFISEKRVYYQGIENSLHYICTQQESRSTRPLRHPTDIDSMIGWCETQDWTFGPIVSFDCTALTSSREHQQTREVETSRHAMSPRLWRQLDAFRNSTDFFHPGKKVRNGGREIVFGQQVPRPRAEEFCLPRCRPTRRSRDEE